MEYRVGYVVVNSLKWESHMRLATTAAAAAALKVFETYPLKCVAFVVYQRLWLVVALLEQMVVVEGEERWIWFLPPPYEHYHFLSFHIVRLISPHPL